MKTAIYIEQGLTQFVLTPETEIDKKVVAELEQGLDLQTYRGSFYDCRGGWMRQEFGYDSRNEPKDDSSLIFVMRPKAKETA